MNTAPKTRCFICGERVVVGGNDWGHASWLCHANAPTFKHRVFEPGTLVYFHQSCTVGGDDDESLV